MKRKATGVSPPRAVVQATRMPGRRVDGADADRRDARMDTTGALAFQRTAGNRAVSGALARNRSGSGGAGGTAMLELPRESAANSLAAAVRDPDVRFRMPTFADLKAVYTDKTLKIPEAVVKDRVRELLGRMGKESRLKSKDPVATIIGKIFPGPGLIDETAFKAALDVADRTIIYQSVVDASTPVKAGDKAKLQTAMSDAADLIKKVEGNAAGLTAVFGTKADAARKNYIKARAALAAVSKDMDKKVSTDYNLDDPEVFLGGWANYGARHMHLLVDIVKGVDPNETLATLIHEASHLSDASVDDQGYYGTPGFESLPEDVKVANAGHYEELPKRELGTSSYAGLTFTPGKLKGGGALTRDDVIRRDASEYLRKAWDAGVDVHTWIRGVRKAQLAGDRAPFAANKALILEVSKLMDLTVHEQDPGAAEITALDVTLTESIARGASLVGQLEDSTPLPAPMGPFKSTADEDAAKLTQHIDDVAKAYGQLLGDPVRDRKLLDWLVAHYRGVPSAP